MCSGSSMVVRLNASALHAIALARCYIHYVPLHAGQDANAALAAAPASEHPLRAALQGTGAAQGPPRPTRPAGASESGRA
jgi:hypothetical protein